ncbi:MAG: DUF1656 domain-containing protein [Halieaceae bacterium]
MWNVPSDLSLSGVYFPPLLAAFVLALFAASLLQKWLDRSGYSEIFLNHSLVYFSLATIFTVVFASTIFPT